MFKEYDDNDFVINYQDDLEKLVTNFVKSIFIKSPAISLYTISKKIASF